MAEFAGGSAFTESELCLTERRRISSVRTEFRSTRRFFGAGNYDAIASSCRHVDCAKATFGNVAGKFFPGWHSNGNASRSADAVKSDLNSSNKCARTVHIAVGHARRVEGERGIAFFVEKNQSAGATTALGEQADASLRGLIGEIRHGIVCL